LKRRKVVEPESTKTWNPGRVHDSKRRNNLIRINIPSHTYSLLATAMFFYVNVVEDDDMEAEESS
jgi:hypothetical protein